MQKTDNTKCWWGCRATKLSFIAGANTKWYSHFERQLAVSYDTVRQLCPWYLSKWFENIYPHKNLHKMFMEIYRSFLNNCQNLEATKILFNRWLDSVVHPDNEYYSALIINELSDQEKILCGCWVHFLGTVAGVEKVINRHLLTDKWVSK